MGKITLCSSAMFFDKLKDIGLDLKKEGFDILLPSLRDFGAENGNAKIKLDLVKEHFRKIDKSDAILIVNFEKKGIKGYIGGNTFLEMGKAFDKGIPIFLLNELPAESPYLDELIAMQPIVINNDLNVIKRMLNE